MNKNTVIIIAAVFVIGAILFGARMSVQKTTLTDLPPAGESARETQQVPDDFNGVMNALSRDMSPWPALSAEQKEVAVNAVIQLFEQQQSGKISREPSYYVRQIDQSLQTNEQFRAMPIDRLLLIFSVMAYDFDNGQDPDVLARQILGPEMYEANKLRLEQAAEAEQGIGQNPEGSAQGV